MRSSVALQRLLGLLCLNEFFRPEVTSAKPKSCPCLKLSNVRQGQMVTTDPYKENNEPKLYCGQQSGQFLAVEDNKLFHLACTGATPITRAKGEDCNMKHYLDYLSQGKTKGAKETCPVFKPLTSKTKIDFQKFRMSGQKVEYAWPSQRYTGSLTAIARAPSQRKSPSTGRVPNVTRSNSPRSRGFLSSSGRWIRRSLSNTSGKNKKLSAEEKMHGSHGGGGVGTTNGGTSGGYSYSGQAGRESGAANRHSAAAGRRPYGGMLPDLSSYWGYGANAGAQQWGLTTADYSES
ncbi:unnamed protein product [Bemisia tabaci]|uniref:Uncharacterized protein n=1 Tax=Bemisia tabaci TaxID=7038 RepID=A0A9P0F090_BEMTA|nr:unnamed protein product [Bemisia tabaci]